MASVAYALHPLRNLSLAPGEVAPSVRDLAECQRLLLAGARTIAIRPGLREGPPGRGRRVDA